QENGNAPRIDPGIKHPEIGDGEILFPVAVEIADGERDRAGPCRVRDGGGKRAIAVAKEDRDVGSVGDDEVVLTVAVEIGDRKRQAIQRADDVSGLKRTIAITEKNI